MVYNKLRIAKIVEETPDARSFVLEIPADLADKYRYRAGQFLTFRVPHPEGAFNRCYSLSSAPETDGLPKVTVKRVEGGKGSNWFHDALKEGLTLEVLPPAGRFVLGEGDAPLLLFGGGSGITPMIPRPTLTQRSNDGSLIRRSARARFFSPLEPSSTVTVIFWS